MTRFQLRKQKEEARLAQLHWLDAMPQDVSATIAYHMHSEEQHCCNACNPLSALLQLAAVSVQQRNAVSESFWNKLVVHSSTPPTWCSVFQGNLREIDFKSYGRSDDFIHLLKEPTLCTAYVSNRALHLKKVSQATQLQELHVKFQVRSPAHYIITALKALDVIKLGFSCNTAVSRYGACIFDVFPDSAAFGDLFSSCPSLRRLDISCLCSRPVTHVMSFFEELPVLKELALNIPFSEDVLPHLRKTKSVSLRFGTVLSGIYTDKYLQFRLATRAGPCITAIEAFSSQAPFDRFYRELILSGADVELLTNCPSLHSLHLGLEAAAENQLPNFSQLDSLRLFWKPNLPLEVMLGNRLSSRSEVYHRLDSSFFNRVMMESPNLKDLCLFAVRLCNTDVKKILFHLGSQLEMFGTSVFFQKEDLYDCVLFRLECVGKTCRSMRQLELRDPGIPLLVYQQQSPMIEVWNELLDENIAVLRRALPQLDIELLYDCLEELGICVEDCSLKANAID